MSVSTLVGEICVLRPENFSARAVRAVQRKINQRLSNRDLAAESEQEKWAVATACSYARGEIGRHLSPEEAATRCYWLLKKSADVP